MKRLFLTLLAAFVATALSAQERAFPTYGVDVEKTADVCSIEGVRYYGTFSVELISSRNTLNPKVKVIIRQVSEIADGKTKKKTILNRTLKNSYLYAFSDGAFDVGNGKAITQLSYGQLDSGIRLVMFRQKGLD